MAGTAIFQVVDDSLLEIVEESENRKAEVYELLLMVACSTERKPNLAASPWIRNLKIFAPGCLSY